MFSLFCFLFAAHSSVATEVRVAAPYEVPFSFNERNAERANETGYVQGFYLDLLQAVAKHESWDLDFRLEEDGDLLQQARAGEIDLAIGLNRYPQPRRSLIYGTESLAYRWGQFYVHAQKQASANVLQRVEILQQGTVYVPRSYGFEQQLQAFVKAIQQPVKIQILNSESEVLSALQAPLKPDEPVRFAVLSQWYGQAELSQISDLQGIRALPLRLPPQALYAASRAGGQVAYLKGLDAVLKKWKADPQSPYFQIRQRWFKPPPKLLHTLPNTLSQWLPLLIGIAGGLLLLLIGLVIYRQRKKVWQNQLEALSALQASEQKYRMLVDSMPYGLQEIDLEGHIIFTNRAEHHIRRYNQEELLGKSILDMMASEAERDRLRAFIAKMIAEQPERPDEHIGIALRQDGEAVSVRSEWDYKRDAQGNLIGFYGVITDVTRVREAQAKIREQHRDLHQRAMKHTEDLKDAYTEMLDMATIIEQSSEGVMVTHFDSCVAKINPAFTKITGYRKEDIKGKPFGVLASPKHDPQAYDKIWKHLKQNKEWQGEVWNRRKNGEIYPAWLALNAVLDKDEQVAHYVGLLSDITRRKQYEKQIWTQANFDNLTKLPNRNLFYKRLENAISKARQGGYQAGLMFIDLDHFKAVNDTLGHDAGDELLIAASKRLSEAVRKGDTVARMGGDEFTVILPQLSQLEVAKKIAADILEGLNKPFYLKVADKNVNISGSIGIVQYPQDGEDTSNLLKHADIAMYEIKERGRNGYFVYADMRSQTQ